MAAQLFEFDVTTPTGTAKAAPQVTALTMPARIVRRIVIKVPPGPNGQLGFAIGMVGAPVIPANAGAFIVTSDETIEWDVNNLPDSGAWQIISYNTGQYPHTIYTRWEVDLVQGADTSILPRLIPSSVITPQPGITAATSAGIDATLTDAQVAADQAAIDAGIAAATL